MIDSNENNIPLVSGTPVSLSPEHFGCSLALDDNLVTLFDGPNVMGKILSLSVAVGKGDSTIVVLDDKTIEGQTEFKLSAGNEIILRRTQEGYVTLATIVTDLPPNFGASEPPLLVAISAESDSSLLAPDPTLLASPMLVPIIAVVESPLVVLDPVVVVAPDPAVVVVAPDPAVVVVAPDPAVVVVTPDPAVVVVAPDPAVVVVTPDPAVVVVTPDPAVVVVTPDPATASKPS